METIAAEIPDRFQGDAWALMRLVYQDPRQPMAVRIDCAKAAIRFERPALSAAHVAVDRAPDRELLAALPTERLVEMLRELDREHQRTIEGAVIADPGSLEASESTR